MRTVNIDVKKSGTKIRNIAEEKGIKPEQIKKELHLGTVQAVYMWYEGRRMPTVDNLFSLARLFRVPMDCLVVGTHDGQSADEQIGEHIEDVFQWAVQESQKTKYMKDRYTYFSKDGISYLLPMDVVLD